MVGCATWIMEKMEDSVNPARGELKTMAVKGSDIIMNLVRRNAIEFVLKQVK